jgi:hypothetical protein
MAELPPNVQEFNVIAGLIFAQLYRAFPVRVSVIDRSAIAKAMGIETESWADHVLPSGRSFPDMVASTTNWLINERYIRASLGAEGATLTERGLAAMNAIPSGLQQSVGTELTIAADKGWTGSMGPIGELIGNMIGGTIKSMGSG